MSNILIGDKAPDFLIDGNIRLSDKKCFMVVYFYPRDNTPGCTIEAKGFNEILLDLRKHNTDIVGISKDSTESHDKFCNKYQLKFSLVSDKAGNICEDYGVWKEKSMFGKKYMGILRKTFLINPDGKIEYIWHKVSVSKHASEILAKIRELTNE